VADWGAMLSSLRQAVYVQPLVCALPGIAIFVMSLSFNLVSDGLRHAMDVKA
jgi:peptide/nickel transport system permease protein